MFPISKISFQVSSSQTFTSVLLGSVWFGFVGIHFVGFCFYKLQLSLNFFSMKFVYWPLFFKGFFSSLGFRFPHVWISSICNLSSCFQGTWAQFYNFASIIYSSSSLQFISQLPHFSFWIEITSSSFLYYFQSLSKQLHLGIMLFFHCGLCKQNLLFQAQQRSLNVQLRMTY